MMSSTMEKFIVRSNNATWIPLQESGVDTTGMFVKALKRDEVGRPESFLIKFEPGASYPFHNHPAGEELLVLEGSVQINGALLNAGDYLYTLPGAKHGVSSEQCCVIFFIVPEEVEIIK